MQVALSDEVVFSLFDEKILACKYLERNGNTVDQDVARYTRESLESVRRDILRMMSEAG
jgi:hypothetical protein